MKFLAAKDIFGTIEPPKGLESFAGSPVGAAGRLLTVGIRLFFIFAGITAMIWMFRGAFDWITSGGDKEKISAARQRVYNAIVGVFILIGILAVISTLEQLVFKRAFCFGLTCSIMLPQVK